MPTVTDVSEVVKKPLSTGQALGVYEILIEFHKTSCCSVVFSKKIYVLKM